MICACHRSARLHPLLAYCIPKGFWQIYRTGSLVRRFNNRELQTVSPEQMVQSCGVGPYFGQQAS